jgi:hypothetical protein
VAATQLRTAESVGRVAAELGTELGWSDEKVAIEAEKWVGEVASEGIDPAGSVAA